MTDHPIQTPEESQPSPPKPDWRAQLRELSHKFKARLETFEPMQVADWTSRTFQRQDMGTYGKAFTIGICAYFLADLAALVLGRYIPEPPVARLPYTASVGKRARSMADYEVIFSRNLFNSRGLIPGEDETGEPRDLGGAPVRTTLPFNLVGTLILRDEMRSIATIEDKTASMVYPVRIQDEIPSKAKILKIEPRRVIFLNVSSGRREFVELPEDTSPAPRLNVSKSTTTGSGIEKVSATQFNINRGEVDKVLSDFNNVLTQARAVPNLENGVPNGYKFFQIVPGSIYDKLGLQNGDVVTGLNGQPINDPGQAFKMLEELKTSSHLELQVKKNGRVQTYSYDIR